jgi:MFS family permease
MVPVAMAVIGDIYPREKRASALGALGAIDTAGWVWGPLYGALLIRFLSWQWQFYLNIPLSLLGIAAAWYFLRDLPQPQTRERIDWLGTAVLTISLISLNVALLSSGDVQAAGGFAQLQTDSSPINNGLLYAIAAVSFLIFLAIQYYLGKQNKPSLPPPLINLSLFRRRNFSPAILINFLVGGILIIAMVNVPLLVNVLEFDVQTAALTSGYLLSGMTGAMAIMAWVGGQLTERLSYRPVTAVGLAFCALGMGLMGWLWLVDTPYLNMGAHLVVLGIGFGLVIAPIGTAVINAAPENQRGVASGLVIVLRLMGMSVGLSGLTAWGLGRFQTSRKLIILPDLPLSDPAYQRALADGLTKVTVSVLTETFLISAGVALLALLVAFWLQSDNDKNPA